MESIMQIVTFNNTELHLVEHSQHEFLLSNKEVALGYGINVATLRSHQSKNQDELIEGKHFIKLEVQTNGGKQKVIHWTKIGVATLGFFIKSENAKEFRKWAANYITNPHAKDDEIENLKKIILEQNTIIAQQPKQKLLPNDAEIKRLNKVIAKQESKIDNLIRNTVENELSMLAFYKMKEDIEDIIDYFEDEPNIYNKLTKYIDDFQKIWGRSLYVEQKLIEGQKKNDIFMNDSQMHNNFLDFMYQANKMSHELNSVRHLSPRVDTIHQSMSSFLLNIIRRYEHIKGIYKFE